MSDSKVRKLILEILVRVERQKAFLNILVPYYFDRYPIKSEDKALIQEITYGVTRFRKKLDWMIHQFLENQNKKLPLTIQNILRMGIYQFLYLNKIPDYAIGYESVELVKNSQFSGYSRLINALLRNMMRRADDIHWPDREQNPVQYISIFYSYPEWLVKRWIKRYGLDICIRICQAGNKKPGLTLRVNSLKTSMPELKGRLTELDIPFKEGQYVPAECLIAKEFLDIGHSFIFLEGLVSIQDESSILASMFLDASPGETVIDMCSGPGGKTMHLAQLMNNQGKIIAFDHNQRRLEMVRRECQRLGIHIVTTVLNDSSRFCADYDEKADKILVDAPCSGTGVIRKKPDLKWKNLNNKRLNELNRLQEAILDVSARYLKPGGEMIYATCSMEKEENDGMISKFLKNHTCFSVQESSLFVKRKGIIKVKSEIPEAIQILPGYSGEDIDGFYLVKMKKIR